MDKLEPFKNVRRHLKHDITTIQIQGNRVLTRTEIAGVDPVKTRTLLKSISGPLGPSKGQLHQTRKKNRNCGYTGIRNDMKSAKQRVNK